MRAPRPVGAGLARRGAGRTAVLGACLLGAPGPVLRAQEADLAERVRCQLVSFRVLQATQGGLTDPRFLQVFDEPRQRAALHAELSTVPALAMVPEGGDTGLVSRAELRSRISARALVTRADIERVDKALTTEHLVSTTVMLEFFNAATGEVYHIQELTVIAPIRKDAGVDLTPGEVAEAFASTLASTVRELVTRLRTRYRPGVSARIVQVLADGRLALAGGEAAGLREGARLEIRDAGGQVVGITRVEQVQRGLSVAARPLSDDPRRAWVGLLASSPGLNRVAGTGGFSHLVAGVTQRRGLVQPEYLLPEATLVYWLHESLAEGAPGLNFLPPLAAGGLVTEQERLELATGRGQDIAGQRVIPDFLVRSAISRADALSEEGPDGATYYILKVGVDLSFYDVRTGQRFYATYVEGSQQERVRAGERELDLSVSYRNLLQRTMAEIGRRVAAEYAPVAVQGQVREVRGDGSVVLGLSGTGSLAAGSVVTLWTDGEEVVDPTTRRSLGRVEVPAARLRIARQSGGTAEALPLSAPARPLAGGRFRTVARSGEGAGSRPLVQVQRAEVRGDIEVPPALLTEIAQTALVQSRGFAVLEPADVLGELAVLREREFGGGSFAAAGAERLLSAQTGQPGLLARVIARFLPPMPVEEGGRPAQAYEARLGIALVDAADTTRVVASAAQALPSRIILPRGRRQVVVGLSAHDAAKIYAQLSRQLAASVARELSTGLPALR